MVTLGAVLECRKRRRIRADGGEERCYVALRGSILGGDIGGDSGVRPVENSGHLGSFSVEMGLFLFGE